MKSGLEDRNNEPEIIPFLDGCGKVSMKSGLEDRNNPYTLSLFLMNSVMKSQ
mgnify:CR=1 FL=1